MFSKPVSIEKPPIFTTVNAQKNAGKVEVFIHIIIFTCYNGYVASIIIKDKPLLQSVFNWFTGQSEFTN